MSKLLESNKVIGRLLYEATDISSLLKDVVSANRFALRNLITLYNSFRGDDPQLQSKDSKLAMQAVLSALSQKDPERSSYFGQMTWEPDALKFAEFLSSVGDRTLAQYLGISSPEDIPMPGDGADLELDGGEISDEGEEVVEPEDGTDLDDEENNPPSEDELPKPEEA
jgi:hypothetical protein